MYIVYVIGHPEETVVFEEKKAACEYALSVAKELGIEIDVYKSSIVATASLPTEPILTKIKKQKFASPEVSKVATEKVVKVSVAKAAKKLNALTKPPLDEVLKEIAEDPEGIEPTPTNDVPLGARCALDNNMAVGKRKGPTGEYVYLCVDCMGALA